jgi:hypothetical protein
MELDEEEHGNEREDSCGRSILRRMTSRISHKSHHTAFISLIAVENANRDNLSTEDENTPKLF